MKNLQICCIPVIKFSSRTVSGKRNLAANGFSPGAPDSYVEEKTDQNIKQNNKRHLLILFCRDLFKSILGNPGQSVGPGEKERRKFSSTGELKSFSTRGSNFCRARPLSQSSSVISDVTSPVKLENSPIALGSKPPLVTRIA